MAFAEVYKDCVIRYSEHHELWEVQIGESYSRHNTPELCRKKVDAVMKKNFKRFDVIIKDYNYFRIATVTSIDNEGCFWALTEGSRRKYESDKVFVLDDISNKRYTEMINLLKKSDEIILNEKRKQNRCVIEFKKILKPYTNKAQS